MAEYKKLIVWGKSIDFCTDIYRVTRSFPSKEDFGITSQLRRASVSIPSNIAEGSKRSTDKDFRSFLRIAHGSGAEIETQLLIAYKLNYLDKKKYIELGDSLDQIMKMLGGLIKKLN